MGGIKSTRASPGGRDNNIVVPSSRKPLIEDIGPECETIPWEPIPAVNPRVYGQTLGQRRAGQFPCIMQVPVAALSADEALDDLADDVVENLDLKEGRQDSLQNEDCWESLYDEHEITMLNRLGKPSRRLGDVSACDEADMLSCESEPPSPMSRAEESRSWQVCDKVVSLPEVQPTSCAPSELLRESTSHGFEYADDLVHSTAWESGR